METVLGDFDRPVSVSGDCDKERGRGNINRREEKNRINWPEGMSCKRISTS